MELNIVNPIKLVRNYFSLYEDEMNGISEDVQKLEGRLLDRGVFLPYEHPILQKFTSNRDHAPLVESIALIWGEYRDQGYRLLLRHEKVNRTTVQPLIDAEASLRTSAYPYLAKFLTGLSEATRETIHSIDHSNDHSSDRIVS